MQIKYINRQTKEILTENPPSAGLLKFLYHNPFGQMAFLPLVKRKCVSDFYGKKMDQAASAEKIQSFVDTYDIDMTESKKTIAEYTSFNDFMYRELKPNSRIIEEGVVSPGDGKIIAFEDVSDIHDFYVKGRKFTLKEYLNDDKLAEQFKHSSVLILRLAPNDYHRFHFPYDGTPSEISKIQGDYFSVSPIALVKNFARVFCENTREFCILSTQDKGDMLVSPVGATMVGTIVETYTPNMPLKKADEMGYFAFGGSTVLLLVDKNKVKIDADILENTKNRLETFVKMGEKIAK